MLCARSPRAESLWLIPPIHNPVLAAAMLIGGVFLNGVATGAYIGAGLGPGPRDGLMTGLVKRTGGSVKVIRTSIEITVLAAGWLLGGTVGVGTVLYAIAIGPMLRAAGRCCVFSLATYARAKSPAATVRTQAPGLS